MAGDGGEGTLSRRNETQAEAQHHGKGRRREWFWQRRRAKNFSARHCQQLFRKNRGGLLLARPLSVGGAVEEKKIVIARAFNLLEAQHLRVREAPLLRRWADQLKNFLRFRRPLGHLRVRVIGNKLQMEAVRTHGATIIARPAAPNQREHRDLDRVAGRQRFFMKQHPETVLPATAGQEDEQQDQGGQRIFHAEYVSPEIGFRSTVNLAAGKQAEAKHHGKGWARCGRDGKSCGGKCGIEVAMAIAFLVPALLHDW